MNINRLKKIHGYIRRIIFLCGIVCCYVTVAWSQPVFLSNVFSVIIKTNATDTTLVSGIPGHQIIVTGAQAQNIGTTGVVNLSLCDGTCTVLANVKYVIKLSENTASVGFTWSWDCPTYLCVWPLTNGNSLIAQADVGATNNVSILVKYVIY